MKDEGNIEGGFGEGTDEVLAGYYLGKWKYDRQNNQMTFKGADPLQLGEASVKVFRVDPEMNVSDYKRLIEKRGKVGAFGRYIDPFDAWDITGNLQVKEGGEAKGQYSLIAHDLMEDSKNGVPRALDVMTQQSRNGQRIINFYACGNDVKGICNQTKPGVCPNGMIAVKEDKGNISCHTYLANSHRAGCFTPNKSENASGAYLISQSYQENAIAAGSGNSNGNIENDASEADNQAHAYGRLGCLNGYKIEHKDGVLKCEDYKNLSGTKVKHCRNKGDTKYELIPVFKDGRLSFQCRDSGKSYVECYNAVSGNSLHLAAGSAALDSVRVIPLGEIINRPSIDKLKDRVENTCYKYNINKWADGSPLDDDYGRRLNIKRGSSMFIVNDHVVCL